jgi:transcriptional regulator with XRE-family HTH domain
MDRVAITRQLRQLIRITRTDRARLSQRAAGEAAGLSEVWWRQIERGNIDYATADTLARMCFVLDITPEQLRRIEQEHVADLVAARHAVLGPEPDELEDYLMKTPGLSDQARQALVSMAKVFRTNQ